MAASVTLTGTTGKIISGSYVLSHGITPSIITVEVIPGTGMLSPLNDITFSDGARQAIFRDCRLANVSLSSNPQYGTVWRVTLHDHRWRWQYGYVTGETAALSAYEIAEFLFVQMGEHNFDISALPQNEGPTVEYDFTNPAEALAELTDRYGLLICYDPETHRIALWPKGSGSPLPSGWPYDAFDHTIGAADVPSEIVGVCEYTEHEVDLELEPVGLDADGTVKHIDALSYRPSGGWGADFFYFGHVSGVDNQKLAQQSVFRWYRVKGNQAVYGWKSVVSLSELRPISGKRVKTETQYATDGSSEVVRKPAFVHGIFDLSKGVFENSATLTKHPDNFQLDEASGIVKFSRPVFATSASVPVAATLYLRATVFSPRYTRSRALGGVYGSLPVPCGGIAHQIVAVNLVDGEAATDNQGTVDSLVDAILDKHAARYSAVQAGQAHYIGIWPAKLDGRIQQVSWDVGSGGAFTGVSENTEHDLRAPEATERRRIEKQRSPVAGGLETQEQAAASPEKKGDVPAARGPRWIRVYNSGANTINAHGPAVLGSIRADGAYNATRPTADDQYGLHVCGPVAIAVGKYGIVSGDFPLPCAVNNASVGEKFGSRQDSPYWWLGTVVDGMIVVAVISTTMVLGRSVDGPIDIRVDLDALASGEFLVYSAGDQRWHNLTAAEAGLSEIGHSH